jgi:hypothetical protein
VKKSQRDLTLLKLENIRRFIAPAEQNFLIFGTYGAIFGTFPFFINNIRLPLEPIISLNYSNGVFIRKP